MERVLAIRNRCLATLLEQLLGLASPISMKVSPIFDMTVARHTAKFPFSGGHLNDIDFDAGKSVLMSKIQQTRIFDEFLAFNLGNPAFIQPRHMLFQKYGTFDFTLGHRIEYRQDVFAFEVRVTFDVLGEITTCASIAIIIDGHAVQNFAFTGFHKELSAVSLKNPQMVRFFISFLKFWLRSFLSGLLFSFSKMLIQSTISMAIFTSRSIVRWVIALLH
jgi:hypothetical protein